MPMLHRRAVLQGLAATGASLAAGMPGQILAQQGRVTALVVLLARGRGRDPEILNAALAAFAVRDVAVGVALEAHGGPVSVAPANGPLDALLWTEGVIDSLPYFQMRRLSALRAQLTPALPAQTALFGLCAPDPGGPLDLRGLRAPGLRTALLVPETSAPAWVERHPAQITVSRGGHLARVGELDAAVAYLDEAIWDGKQTHGALYIDLDGPPDEVRDLVEQIAAEVAHDVEAGRISPLLADELSVRNAGGFERLVGLRLDPPPEDARSATETQALDALSAALAAAGIGHSIAHRDAAALGAPDCLWLPPGAPGAAAIAERPMEDCVLVAPPDPGLAPTLADAGTRAAMGVASDGFRGLDGNGLYHLGPIHQVASGAAIRALSAQLAFSDEPVIALDTTALLRPAQINAAVAALRDLAATAGTRIVDLDSFARQTSSTGPIFDTLRIARVRAAEDAPEPRAPLTDAARAALMDDARRAWAYFEAVTVPETGLPAATVQFYPNGGIATRYDTLTQWDMGSVIFANIAAHDLGLIDSDRFGARRAAILASLEAATFDNPRLPRAEFDTRDPRLGARAFNVCDTGRLLSALRALDQRARDGDPEVRGLVASWDLDQVIVDGVANSIERGRLVPGTDSHCTGYMAHAYRYWGQVVISVYDTYYSGETETDRRMHLLNAVASIGTLGPEPLLFQVLEFGLDPPTRYLAEVLFSEQRAEAAASGRVVAPSEAPMERAPWFTYQGLRVDLSGEPRWAVRVLTGEPEYNTPEFRAATRMVATKAAYLWAVTYPHPYSDRLLAYARAHGRLPKGFAAAIYTATDQPTKDYADVNTNGVVLQSIAALLRR